jgi:demethylmenaquinone methyltransferase/2-methoxy-6-polyprenyl-1,4-benzoquinol methylase
VFAGLISGDRAAYVYLNETIRDFPDREGLSAEIRGAGFSEVFSKAMTFGIVALHEAVAS